MKIVHVTPVYPPYKGGMGKVAFDYVELLRKRGECVSVLTPDYEDIDRTQKIDGEEIEWLHGFAFGKAAVLPQLLWKVKDCDVVHLHYPFYGTAIFTALGSVIWKKKLVVTYHMKTKGTGFLGAFFSLHRLLLEPIILMIANSVLVSSIDYASSIELRHKNLIDAPFGVDVDRFSLGESDVRSKLGISNNSKVGIFVGGLDDAHYFKGVDVLLEATSKLNKDDVWDIIIVGGGNRKDNLKVLARELGVEDRIHFAGRVLDEDLPNFYRTADFHILPSIDRSEAFGLVTLEAAVSGIPSIVSDLPGVRTLVVDKKTGLHFAPNDVEALKLAITWMLDHADKVKEFGKNAKQRVSQYYSEEKMIDRLQLVYKNGNVKGV